MEEVQKGEEKSKCQDLLSAASERNPVQMIIATLNENGEINVSRLGSPQGMALMLAHINVLVNDDFRKQLRL